MMAVVRSANPRLSRRSDFTTVMRHGRRSRSRLLRLAAHENGLHRNRYGFAISRRVGNAVVRNKARRRLRAIIRQTALTPGNDIVITADPLVENASYQELTAAFETIARKLSLIDGSQ
ncbi:MAG TPA: ribonuclease P protein component [Dehalococcoidia bacterium]|nr:ribonuclease P protein component [Dehalococcoidia bacterium]